MTTAEILIAARELLSTPEKWAKGGNAFSVLADTTTHKPPMDTYVPAEGPGAVSFCVSGAILKVGGVENRDDPEAAFCSAVGVGPFPYLYADKATTTHADVLAAFDRAIEAVTS